jgi:hypothetical protein
MEVAETILLQGSQALSPRTSDKISKKTKTTELLRNFYWLFKGKLHN